MSNQTQNQAPVDNRSASQKISDLENAVLALYQNVSNHNKDLVLLKETSKLLDNKTSSIIEALSSSQQVTEALIDSIMTKNSIAELKAKVDNMVNQGFMKATDVVAQDSFLVGQGENADGTVVNPRHQFAVYQIVAGIRENFIGKKVGDVITVAPGEPLYRINEIYQIQKQEPQAPTVPSDEQAEQALAESAAAPAQSSESDPASAPSA